MNDYLRIPGVACRCGSTELRIVAPGADRDAEGGGAVLHPVADLGWCSVACARIDGWPFLASETQTRRHVPACAPEAGGDPAGDVPCLLDVSPPQTRRRARSPGAAVFLRGTP